MYLEGSAARTYIAGVKVLDNQISIDTLLVISNAQKSYHRRCVNRSNIECHHSLNDLVHSFLNRWSCVDQPLYQIIVLFTIFAIQSLLDIFAKEADSPAHAGSDW